ncbi:MAG: hypothetical protein R2851_24870 [Caldilineaceae bacterium]
MRAVGHRHRRGHLSLRRELPADPRRPASWPSWMSAPACWRGATSTGGDVVRHGHRPSAETLFTPTAWLILQECGPRLREFGDRHIEYILLALHVMHAGYKTTNLS